MTKRSRSSSRWLERQRRDPFVRQAQGDGWRSRAAYKLAQIDKRDSIIRAGMTIIDLGCAPGGWAQYALKKMKGNGRVLGLDLLPTEPLAGLQVYQGDFQEPQAIDWIANELGSTRYADLVMSDMAPNISGNRLRDQAQSLELINQAVVFCEQWLVRDGDLLFKAFQGEDLPDLVDGLKSSFRQVLWRKPEASRQDSREVFVLARGHRMIDNHE